MRNRTKNRERLIVETGGESMYCHNSKCGFYNVGVGCNGYDEGDKPKCDICRKPTYTATDGSGKSGDTSKVDI